MRAATRVIVQLPRVPNIARAGTQSIAWQGITAIYTNALSVCFSVRLAILDRAVVGSVEVPVFAEAEQGAGQGGVGRVFCNVEYVSYLLM